MPRQKETEVSEVASRDNATLDEIKNSPGIERASENDIIKEADMLEFMNDVLTIVVAADGNAGAYDVITPSVASINQPIIRGREQKVKRKYVAALANSRISTYRQVTPNPDRREHIEMQEISVVTYPFTVIHDPHPNGAAWLKNMMNQPA